MARRARKEVVEEAAPVEETANTPETESTEAVSMSDENSTPELPGVLASEVVTEKTATVRASSGTRGPSAAVQHYVDLLKGLYEAQVGRKLQVASEDVSKVTSKLVTAAKHAGLGVSTKVVEELENGVSVIEVWAKDRRIVNRSGSAPAAEPTEPPAEG